MTPQHYGYQQAKVIITDTDYSIIESFLLPCCSSTGKTRSFEFAGSRQETWKNSLIDSSEGQRLKYVLNFDEYANKDSVAMFLKILNYNNDGARGRGKKYLYLMPHIDRPYIIHKVVLNNTSFDLQLLEATDYTDGYMLPVLEFITVDLVDAYDTITELPTSPDLWIKSTEVQKYYAENDSNAYVLRAIDQSSYFRNMTGTLPKLINNVLNGYPAIRFDGFTTVLQTPTWTLRQDLTLYAVLRVRTWVTGKYIFDGYTSNKFITKFRTATTNICFSANNTDFIDNSDLNVFNTFIVQITSRDGADSRIRVNNNTEITGTAGSGNPAGLTIGANGSAVADFSQVDIFEVLVFPVNHSVSESSQVRNYLSRKYFNTTY